MTIAALRALEILDSRGNPTIEVFCVTDQGVVGKAAIPSGASTGEHEAVELRDQDKNRYFGKGVKKAIANVTSPLAKLLVGQSLFQQAQIDQMMIKADGTENKSHLGANAILGVSLAVARAAAQTRKEPLYQYIGGVSAHLLPCPMMNIINGGVHADSFLDFQEFMIRPIGAPTFSEGLRYGVEVFHTLKALLKAAGHVVSVGDEGGFAPRLESNEEALDFIMQAIEKAGYKPGKDLSLALDCAASEFYDKKQKRYIERKKQQMKKSFASRTAEEQTDYLEGLIKVYPIDVLEDPLDQNDWDGWQFLTKKLGKKVQVVGDDIFVTNPRFLKKGFELGVANAILIKLNQIGTLTETLATIDLAKQHGYGAVISHRSGETEDSTISDLAVATGVGLIKTGSLSRSDRVAKYNRLIEIEAELGPAAKYA